MPCPISNSDGFRFCFFGDVLISSVRSLRSFFMYWSEGVEGAGSLAAGVLKEISIALPVKLERLPSYFSP